jgi:hypothetical protein
MTGWVFAGQCDLSHLATSRPSQGIALVGGSRLSGRIRLPDFCRQLFCRSGELAKGKHKNLGPSLGHLSMWNSYGPARRPRNLTETL